MQQRRDPGCSDSPRSAGRPDRSRAPQPRGDGTADDERWDESTAGSDERRRSALTRQRSPSIVPVCSARPADSPVVDLWRGQRAGRVLDPHCVQSTSSSLPRHKTPYRALVALNFSYWYSWAVLVPGILWLARRYPFERHTWGRAVSAHVPGVLVFTRGPRRTRDVVPVPDALGLRRAGVGLVLDGAAQRSSSSTSTSR